MEDVLEVYRRPHDPQRPQVCLDETSKQLLAHTRVPVPARRGTPVRVDDEYKRCGTANIFAAVEPLTGKSLVEVTEHRTAVDMAHFLRRLSDEIYWAARVIVLVMDNLNIHSLSCLYEAFAPREARRLAERFEIHHTPKHGSWLNVAVAAGPRGCQFRRNCRSPGPQPTVPDGAGRDRQAGSSSSLILSRIKERVSASYSGFA